MPPRPFLFLSRPRDREGAVCACCVPDSASALGRKWTVRFGVKQVESRHPLVRLNGSQKPSSRRTKRYSFLRPPTMAPCPVCGSPRRS